MLSSGPGGAIQRGLIEQLRLVIRRAVSVAEQGQSLMGGSNPPPSTQNDTVNN